jgi:hypothetical protein
MRRGALRNRGSRVCGPPRPGGSAATAATAAAARMRRIYQARRPFQELQQELRSENFMIAKTFI